MATDVQVNQEAKEIPINNETNGTVNTEQLNSKIIKQIEYYFGNYNLPRDKFLSEQVKSDDGWISLDTMVKFKRLSSLTVDYEVIKSAVKKSEIMEVDDKKNRIRRSPNHPLPFVGDDIKAETVKKTIYCKGFPKDGSIDLDQLLEFFKPYGPFDTIHMRMYFEKTTKKQGFKGSILIVFPTVEKAKEFIDVDDIKFRNTPLLRKWHQDYIDQKAEEIRERQARKDARLEQLQKETASNLNLTEIEPIPRGSFLFASGFTNTTVREDIRAALLELTDDVGYLDFNKGDTEGYIRMATPYSNKKALGLIEGKLKVNGADISVRIVEGEEENEQVKKGEAARTKVLTSGNRKKRKFGGMGSHHKRRKCN